MKSRQWAVVAVVVLSLYVFASAAKAQAQARPSGTNIAMVDIKYIFKHHPRLKQRLDEWNGEFARAREAANKRDENLRKAAEELRGIKKGTPDYKGQEESLAKEISNFKTELELQQKELQERRIKVHYEAYQEVYQATEYYCNQAGIDLVIQFDGDQPSIDTPETLAAQMSKLVVWHKQPLDITPEILKLLNGNAPATANRNNNAAPARQQSVPYK
jgi:Skp family chaperone for outer membrane proteins